MAAALMIASSVSLTLLLFSGPMAAPAAGAMSPQTKSSIWSAETTVNPSPTDVNDTYFEDVSSSGPDDAWAVGVYADSDALNAGLAEHWNGTSWELATLPVPSGDQATLDAVDDVAPDNVWAVGTTYNGSAGTSPDGVTLIEHFDGTSWSIIPSPNGATGTPGDSNILDAIAGTDPDDLWAAGYVSNNDIGDLTMLFEHWNGTSWSLVAAPGKGNKFEIASSLVVISSDDVWAVGSFASSATLAANWNGTKWSIVKTPNFVGKGHPENLLSSVSAFGPNDVWASGYAFNVNDENFALPYVLHWNGSTWSMTEVPNHGSEGSRLRGIQVLSRNDVWAVGQAQQDDGAILSLTEQFNGKSWSIQKSPDPGILGKHPDNSLASVASGGGSNGTGNLLAVGAQEDPGQCCLRTLAIGTTQG